MDLSDESAFDSVGDNDLSDAFSPEVRSQQSIILPLQLGTECSLATELYSLVF